MTQEEQRSAPESEAPSVPSADAGLPVVARLPAVSPVDG